MKNFWLNLPTPFFVLAPMEGVTDFVFREMVARFSGGQTTSPAPTSRGTLPTLGEEKSVNHFVMFTEFVNVNGITHKDGFEKLKIDLKYSESQRPIVAQIWGREPEKFKQAAQIITSLGFDGIDINMGCPKEKEIAQKTCAYLIREPALAGEIIQATLEGAGHNTTPSRQAHAPLLGKEGINRKAIPVSVKTRLGYSSLDEMENWVSELLKYSISALTLHARTKKEMSKVPAHWDYIKRAVGVRNQVASSKYQVVSNTNHQAHNKNHAQCLIIGNGDVKSYEDGLVKAQETGCDGVMIGRAAFGNPWLFRANGFRPTVQERLSAMLEHAEMFEQEFAGIKSFETMKKNFKEYASSFPLAHELRAILMLAKNNEEVKKITQDFFG